MKNVILSAGSALRVYSVPDVVADNLNKYCIEFCDKWLRKSPHARKYRIGGGCCYAESDFIEYLNRWIFPDTPSKYVETLEWVNPRNLPAPYREYPYFNF